MQQRGRLSGAFLPIMLNSSNHILWMFLTRTPTANGFWHLRYFIIPPPPPPRDDLKAHKVSLAAVRSNGKYCNSPSVKSSPMFVLVSSSMKHRKLPDSLKNQCCVFVRISCPLLYENELPPPIEMIATLFHVYLLTHFGSRTISASDIMVAFAIIKQWNSGGPYFTKDRTQTSFPLLWVSCTASNKLLHAEKCNLHRHPPRTGH